MMENEATLTLCSACHRNFGFFYPLPNAEDTALDKKTLFSVIASFVLRFDNKVTYIQVATFLNSIKFATLTKGNYWTQQNVRSFLTSKGVDIDSIKRMAKGISPISASDADCTKIVETAISVMEIVFQDDVNNTLTELQKDIVVQSYAKTDVDAYLKLSKYENTESSPEGIEETQERLLDFAEKFGG